MPSQPKQPNIISIKLNALEFLGAMKRGINLYSFVGWHLMNRGIKIKDVTDDKLVVAEGEIDVSINKMYNTLEIFWYRDRKYLH